MSSANPPRGKRQVPVTNCSSRILTSLSDNNIPLSLIQLLILEFPVHKPFLHAQQILTKLCKKWSLKWSIFRAE